MTFVSFMKKAVSIGRSKSNDLIIDFQQVSGNHAVITPIAANSLIIEDLGSTNGTFVNGVQIKRKILNRADRVKIANILVDTKPYFVSSNNHSGKDNVGEKNTLTQEESIQKQFKKLEETWNIYQKIKINHKKKGFWKNMGLTVAGMGIGALLVPFTGGISIMAGSLVGRGAAGLLKDDEKIQVVENEFKVNYTCPKCKVFLGYNPYEGLVQRKKCLTCKTNWV
jgi:hypothetical protein